MPMQAPSAKRLLATFRDLTPEQARLIRALAHATDDAAQLAGLIAKSCPETDKYARSCYSDPYDSGMWRRTMALHAIDRVLGTFGVEPLGRVSMRNGPPFEYLNTGDTYATTLVYHRNADALRIGCWGSIAERMSESDLSGEQDW
jgi:hypothetical protein